MASSAIAGASSKVSPSVTSPGSAGLLTTYPPSSAGLKEHGEVVLFAGLHHPLLCRRNRRIKSQSSVVGVSALQPLKAGE